MKRESGADKQLILFGPPDGTQEQTTVDRLIRDWESHGSMAPLCAEAGWLVPAHPRAQRPKLGGQSGSQPNHGGCHSSIPHRVCAGGGGRSR